MGKVDSLKFFIDQLYEAAQEHFAREEKLQLKFMFPYYEENKSGHQRLMAELDDIKNIIYAYVGKAAISPEDSKETTDQVNHLIRNWFIDHIIKSDMKMKGFMDNAL